MSIPTEYGAAYVKLRTLIEKHPCTFSKIVCDYCFLDAGHGLPKAERVAWMRTGLELVEAIHGAEHAACIEFLEWLAADSKPKAAREYLIRAYPIAVANPAVANIPLSHFAYNAADACFALGLKYEGFNWVLRSLRDDLERGSESYWGIGTVDEFLAHLEGTNHDAAEWFAIEAECLKRDGRTLPEAVLAKRVGKAVRA